MASILTLTLPFDRVGFTVESGTAYVVATRVIFGNLTRQNIFDIFS